jgi:hypothetical protein
MAVASALLYGAGMALNISIFKMNLRPKVDATIDEFFVFLSLATYLQQT